MGAIAKGPQTAEEKLLHALRHPLRVELLRHFVEGTCSPNELAARLGKPLGHVSYHVRELDRAGAIELVEERKVRGAVEHFYRGVARVTILEDEWTALDPSARAEISSRVLQNIFGEAYAALHDGTLDSRMDRHLTWRSVSLDEEGWKELADLLLSTLFKVEEIEDRSIERRMKGDVSSPPVAAIVALMGFERGEIPRA